MGISDDLKQRLRNIELEQKRQELALKKLDDFEQKIKDLEAQLQQIDGFEIKLQQEVNYGQLRNLDETQRIEAELRRMDKEYHARDFNELRYFEEIAQLREKLSGEINSLKDRRDRLLDRQMGTFQEEPKTTTPGVDQSPSPKKVAQPLMNTENSKETKEFAVQLSETDYEAENSFEERYFAEIQELRNGVSKEKGAVATAPPPSTTKNPPTLTKIQPVVAQSKQTRKQKVTLQSGYVICLMLNPEAPTEWSGELESGGGWREPGKGTCYLDVEQVKRCLRDLKKQWPTYPLKVVRRLG